MPWGSSTRHSSRSSEFADQFSGSQEIRLMLVELLRAASREDEAREQLEKLAGEIEGRDRPDARRSQEIPQVDLDESAAARSRGSLAGLVFLDTGLEVPTSAPRAEEVGGSPRPRLRPSWRRRSPRPTG